MAYDNSDVIGFIGRVDKEHTIMKVIRNNQVLSVGRHCTNDISPQDDKKISRGHGSVEAQDRRVMWRVAKSKNGTFINGRLVDYPHMVMLWDGDTITIGDTPLTYMERR